MRKIHFRESPVTADDDGFWAGCYAVIATGAGVNELRFRKRPWGAIFNFRARAAAEKTAAAGIYHRLLGCLHFVDATAQQLINF